MDDGWSAVLRLRALWFNKEDPVDSNSYQPTPASIQRPGYTHRPLALIFAFAVGIPLTIDLAILLAAGTVDRFMWLFVEASSMLLFVGPNNAGFYPGSS